MLVVNLDQAYSTYKAEPNISKTYDYLSDFQFHDTNGLFRNIAPQKVKFYVISICLCGIARKQIGLSSYTFAKSSVYFLKPGQVHSLEGYDEDFKGLHIFFDKSFLSDHLSDRSYVENLPFFQHNYKLPLINLSPEELQSVLELFLAIEREYNSDEEDRANLIKANLYTLTAILQRIYRRKNSPANYTTRSTLVDRFKLLVDTHFLDKRSVSEYADILTIHPKNLTKVVKKETGFTALYFVQERLLIESKVLLRYSSYTVTEVAEHLNFSDQSYFCKFFKRGTSMTPTQYRKDA